jgi:ankyrin repeat protein
METVLHVACRQRDYELARMFLENGVDINTQDVSADDFDFKSIITAACIAAVQL